MTPEICNVCTIYVFAKLGHPTALVLVTADDKVYFIEDTEIFWNIDLLFNIKYRPAAKTIQPLPEKTVIMFSLFRLSQPSCLLKV